MNALGLFDQEKRQRLTRSPKLNRRHLRKRLLKITQALRRNSLRPFVEFEYYRHDAVVVYFLECGTDGLEIYVSKPGPLRFSSLAWK